MKITLSFVDARDRESIYAIRHQIYGRELRQHPANAAGRLSDWLDEVNTCLVAKRSGEVAGFVTVTPPNKRGYSLDKYFPRESLPLKFDQGLYEVRLLTVPRAHRGTPLAFLLMYGALRYVESHGGSTIAAIGRLEVLEMYEQVGFKSLGFRAKAGSVTYELMSADIRDLRSRLAAFEGMLLRVERVVDWQLNGVPFRSAPVCYHGGAFFDAIGEEFETLEKKDTVINADVLDAWFEPAPPVIRKLTAHLAFALKTSPPSDGAGMCRVIARARSVPEDSILPGAGSSDLIYAGLRFWVTPASRSSAHHSERPEPVEGCASIRCAGRPEPGEGRVLILDPMYGEYAHVLEKVIGAHVDRLTLSKARGYEVDIEELVARVRRGYNWVVLVNPNSPTGRHIPRRVLERVIAEAPTDTRWWIDETYVDYAGAGESLEVYASSSTNVVICKSMSKVYALSGVRAAYLCGPRYMIDALKPFCPPWSVSLPGQIAACEALKAIDYYQARWEETHRLRAQLAEGLQGLGWEIVPGCANFLLCHLPPGAPEAAVLVRRASERGLFLRDVANMGSSIDARTLRVAVKDRETNLAMLEILRVLSSGLGRTSIAPSSQQRVPKRRRGVRIQSDFRRGRSVAV